MKKIVILAIVAILLAATGGLVYAQTHQTITGQKLVGLGAYGVIPHLSGTGSYSGHDHVQFVSSFGVTNPSCNTPISIQLVQVMDQDGATIFSQGPGTYTITYTHPIYPSSSWTRTVIIPSQLQPHESWWFRLDDVTILPGIGYGEPSYNPAVHDPKGTPRLFTVEIAWSSGEEGYPLTGVVKEMVVAWNGPPPGTHDMLSMSETAMMNLPLFVGPPPWAGRR